MNTVNISAAKLYEQQNSVDMLLLRLAESRQLKSAQQSPLASALSASRARLLSPSVGRCLLQPVAPVPIGMHQGAPLVLNRGATRTSY
jgi:hypothetical protein